MLMSAVLTSEDNKRISRIKSVKTVRYRVDNRDQVLVLAYSHENLELNQGSCSKRT